MKSYTVTRRRSYRCFFSVLILTLVVLLGEYLINATSVVAQDANATAAQEKTANTTPQNTAAATAPAKTSTTAPAPGTSLPEASPTPPVVEAVRNADYKVDKNGESYAGLNDIIVVETSNLRHLIREAKCLDANGIKKQTPCTEHEIALFLDGREVKGLIPESGAPIFKSAETKNGDEPTKLVETDDGALQFHLKREVGVNDETWADIFGGPPLTFDERLWYRPTEVSVGLAGGFQIGTKAKAFNLVRIRRGWFWITSGFLLALLVGIIWLARKTDLLRDPAETAPGTRKQYSLARCQMAFWFVLVIAAFIFIWRVTGAMDIITPSVLALIGIGAGTALGSAAIDAGKHEERTNQLTSLGAEKDALVAMLTALNTEIEATADATKLNDLRQQQTAKLTRLNEVNAKITQLSARGVRPSRSFLSDWLTDANGYSFHRLQMFVWTLVLGALFVHSLWSRVSMPEFSPTLLALMGISAGTFLGFKLPVNQP